ncbi:biofilm development regulator YmgB/AriR family protein [Kluyvera sp. NPDC087067]|uniref:biofilm development regulator YmgB/AriR family protein n=1 Tax=unclassified Kluyvera TaxID=2619995 RepID=UPI003828DE81
MPQQSNFNSFLADKSLNAYFQSAGDRLEEESQVLDLAIKSMISDGQHINNKSIISNLIHTLECTDDIGMAHVVRNTLEIVVNHTVDDI